MQVTSKLVKVSLIESLTSFCLDHTLLPCHSWVPAGVLFTLTRFFLFNWTVSVCVSMCFLFAFAFCDWVTEWPRKKHTSTSLATMWLRSGNFVSLSMCIYMCVCVSVSHIWLSGEVVLFYLSIDQSTLSFSLPFTICNHEQRNTTRAKENRTFVYLCVCVCVCVSLFLSLFKYTSTQGPSWLDTACAHIWTS